MCLIQSPISVTIRWYNELFQLCSVRSLVHSGLVVMMASTEIVWQTLLTETHFGPDGTRLGSKCSSQAFLVKLKYSSMLALWPVEIKTKTYYCSKRERPLPLTINQVEQFYCQCLFQKNENLNSISIATKAWFCDLFCEQTLIDRGVKLFPCE